MRCCQQAFDVRYLQFPGYDSSADVERKLKQGVINRIAITPQMQVCGSGSKKGTVW